MQMIARALFITALVLALAQAAPPMIIRSNVPQRCADVKYITYNTETEQCSMDIQISENDAFVPISGHTLQTLVNQTSCDFIPFLIGTTQCSELIKAMPIQ
jgi:hypothetical protein